MDSARIKRLATGAREALRREVEGRLDAVLAAGSAERLADPAAVERLERLAAADRDRVVDSAAYTWFNRLCALRLMDARGYTPVPVVTPRPGSTLPAVLADAQAGSFAPEYGLSPEARARVSSLLAGGGPAANATEAAYAELLRAVCERYAGPMPYLFGERAASWLLMPQGLLAEGSILRRIAEGMDAESCGSVEVLGWLYQHYIAERKDEVFASFKKGKKAGPAEIGPATQLFTPAWIVRYLCENSLGRLWMLNNPASGLAGHMEYYIAPEGGEPCARVASAGEIRVLDPACGSGHILVYAFDLLFAMYEEEGWPPEDIPAMILRDNLKGLEVDGRAAEIAKFALAMKARERDPRFLERAVEPDVTVLEAVGLDGAERELLSSAFLERTGLIDAMEHMSEVGSLFQPAAGDADAIRAELARLRPRAGAGDAFAAGLAAKLEAMLANVEALSGTYHCVIANPPYMGTGSLEKQTGSWVKEHYPDSKADLCTCFIERGFSFAGRRGYNAMVTMQSWMFLGSFERLRAKLIADDAIVSMAHLGTRAFDSIAGEVVSTTASVIEKSSSNGTVGSYVRLVDVPGEQEKAEAFKEAIRNPGCGWFYRRSADSFKSIPGTPIAYWASDAMINAFVLSAKLSDVVAVKKGLDTGDNDKYLRLWFEIGRARLGLGFNSSFAFTEAGMKWAPHDKGGEYRKWYGNNDWVINWEDDGSELRNSKANLRSERYYFSEAITWSSLSSGSPSFRFSDLGAISNTAGSSMYPEHDALTLLGYMNSSVVEGELRLLAPTLNYSAGPVGMVPNPSPDNSSIAAVQACVALSKSDWDSFETSWDFKRHPLV